VPTGPKGISGANPPTGPRSERGAEKRGGTDNGGYTSEAREEEKNKDFKLAHRVATSPILSPSKPPAIWASSDKPLVHPSPSGPPPQVKPWTPPQQPQATPSRPGSSPSAQVSAARPLVGSNAQAVQGRAGSPGPHSTHPPQGPSMRPIDSSMSATIPTGPKAERLGLVGGMGRGRGQSWRGSGLSPFTGRGGAVPAKRTHAGDEKERPISAGRINSRYGGHLMLGPGDGDENYKQQSSPEGKVVMDTKTRQSNEMVTKLKSETEDVDMVDAPHTGESTSKPEKLSEPGYPLDLPPDRMDIDFEDDVGMDVDDFKANDEQYDIAIAELEAKLRQLRSDKELLYKEIYEKEQFLKGEGMNLPQESPPPSAPPILTRQGEHDSASPEEEESTDSAVSSTAEEDVLQDLPMNRVKTPSIEKLPYLCTDPIVPLSEIEVFQENLYNHRAIGGIVIGRIKQQRKSKTIRHDEQRKMYAELYKPWRLRVDELDEEKRRSTVYRDPSVTAPDTQEDAHPSLIIEGRRGGKFSSALEYEQVLKESAAAAKELKERAEREEKAREGLPFQRHNLLRQTRGCP
jgi:hypothetical protein